jgi:predicted  nucleic acid-binding Zn-ribbon protein
MSASLGLYRLQSVDRQIDQVETGLARIREILENDAELKQATSALEEARKNLHHARQELRTAEAETINLRNKIEKTESELYSGKVQNPKELQDLQLEVASLRKRMSALEENELASMGAVETQENALKEVSSELEKLESRLGNEHQNLLMEQARFQNEMIRLTEEREASAKPIETTLLQQYENLRRQKKGVAVAGIAENSCDACGVVLTQSLQQIAKSNIQLTFCPSCGRILYMG